MAKRKRTRRRKSTSLAAAPRRRSSAPRRRRRKGPLGDMFNPTVAKNSAIRTAMGMLGGAGAATLNKMLPPNWGKLAHLGLGFGGGFVVSALVGQEALGSGFAGGMAALAFKDGFLNDDADFADDDSLSDEDAPIYLDEDGNPLMLNEDGSATYLSEEELSAMGYANYNYIP